MSTTPGHTRDRDAPTLWNHLVKTKLGHEDSPESDEMSEAKEGTFSSGGCLPLFGVSLWLCAGETTHGGH